MDDDLLLRGTIRGVSGDGGSVLILNMEVAGRAKTVYAEGRHMAEALRDAFGSVEAALGQEIEYDTDDIGMMTNFRVA